MPDRFILSLRERETGGGVTSALILNGLYAVKNPAPTLTDNNDFKAQLSNGGLAPPTQAQLHQLRHGRTCFIAHGYNTSRSRGLWSGEELGSQALRYDNVVAVLWPGDSGVFGPLVYSFVLNNAKDAGRRLADFLRFDVSPTAEVCFVTHSFGIRVVLSATSHLRTLPGQQGRRFTEAVFMASAADETVLQWPEHRAALATFNAVTVLSSMEDNTLQWFYPAGDFVEDAFHRGERGNHRALGRYGPVRRREDQAFNGKLDHIEIDPSAKQDHNDYMPWPWQRNGVTPGGWQGRRERVRSVLQDKSRGVAPTADKLVHPDPRYS